MTFRPNWLQGAVVSSFDLRLEPGAILWHEWRDASNPYKVGPSLRFLGTGQLKHGDRVLMPLPVGEWFHVDIRAGVGAAADGTFRLEVQLAGGEVHRFGPLGVGTQDWKTVNWAGFVSEATEPTVFYIDNLRLQKSAADAVGREAGQ